MPMPRLCGGMLLIGFAAQTDLAMGRGLEPGQHHQAGCLARARWPEHGQKLAFRHCEVQVFDDQNLPIIAFLYAVKLDECLVG